MQNGYRSPILAKFDHPNNGSQTWSKDERNCVTSRPAALPRTDY